MSTAAAHTFPGPVPEVAEVFAFAREEIRSAAAELWPGGRIELSDHIPGVTGYVHRIRMGGRELYAKHSFLGMSLVSILRGIGQLAAALRGYTGTVLVVTNPVDVMTRLVAELSGCERVFGIGSNLDSARYRAALARPLHVPAAAVAGHVIGEHGDAAVVCASATTVNDQRVPLPLRQLRDELATRAGRISAGIGRTRSGPAGAVLSALRKTLALTSSPS